jgi:predicted enzyme related to lactoylglutathione lyase
MEIQMPNSQKPGAVVFAKDLVRIARFYEAVCQMTTTHTDKDLVVLESAMQQLVIHGIPKKIAQSITISSPPRPRSDTAVKLVFPVDSIAKARIRAGEFGGGIHPATNEFVARGFRACDGFDPEGNVVQFREDAS